MEKLQKRALCIVNNAELVRNNCATFKEQGGTASIYCAALHEKDDSASIIFGTPQSILNGITKNERIAKIKFNIIVIDEAHAINYLDDSSVFMRILRYYKQQHPPMRILGATGTNFRFKGTEIFGNSCFFKKQVGNITTEQLIKDNYLINPQFEIDPNLIIDFTKVKIKKNGLFDPKGLELVVSENARLTELICKQIIYIVKTQSRYGVFIFATTKKHAFEILSHLPKEESAIILGETPQDERTEILEKARKGKIKYLVNIAIISVGVDVPAYDTIAYLRPTESLVLLVQTMGRALRLSPSTNKKNALVLDFAGNIERHRDWDNPILLDAVKKSLDENKPLVIECPCCRELNTESARRCVGINSNKRCDYYFEFKECPDEKCKTKNDIAVRHCRVCGIEIIDPNARLKLPHESSVQKEMEVINAKYGISETRTGFKINCLYRCKDDGGKISSYYESYTPINDKAKHVFYGQFIKKHCDKPSEWYPFISTRSKMEHMLETIKTPTHLLLHHEDGGYKIKKKIFQSQQGTL
jgi:DNA repair protein RadD